MGLCAAKAYDDQTELHIPASTLLEAQAQSGADFALYSSISRLRREGSSNQSDSEDDFKSCASSRSSASSSEAGDARPLTDLQGELEARLQETCLRLPRTLGDLPEVSTKTLSDLRAEKGSSNSYEDYLRRKERRKNKRGSRQVDRASAQDFLSGVPEVDTDIPYRYSFLVLGTLATQAVESACNSEAAKSLPHAANADNMLALSETAEAVKQGAGEIVEAAAGEPSSPPLSPSDPHSRKPRRPTAANRCLCPVPFPFGRTDQNERLKLAKLVFNHDRRWQGSSWEEPPECRSRLEASTTCMIFVLSVDSGSESFTSQMQSVTDLLQLLRCRSSPELRPVRAMLLCRSGEQASVSEKDSDYASEESIKGGWRSELSEFEDIYGPMWKFGPIDIQNGVELHSVFATIASERIQKNRKATGDNDVAEDEEEEDTLPPMWGEAECDEVVDAEPSQNTESASRSGPKKRLSQTLNGLLGRSQERHP